MELEKMAMHDVLHENIKHLRRNPNYLQVCYQDISSSGLMMRES